MGLLQDPEKVEYLLVPRLGPHPQLTMYLQNYDGINQVQEQGFNVSDKYSCTTYDFPNIPFLNNSAADLYSPLLQLTLKAGEQAVGMAGGIQNVGAEAYAQSRAEQLNKYIGLARAQSNVNESILKMKLDSIYTKNSLFNSEINIPGSMPVIPRDTGYEHNRAIAAAEQAQNNYIKDNASGWIKEAGKQLADTYAKLDTAQIQSKGTVGGQWMQNYVFSVNLCRYEISQLRLIKQYVERYGLSCYSIINKWAPERQRFDYVECQDIVINGDLPQEAKAYISQMFTEGVMFWHDNNLFDYSNNGDA